MLIRSLGRFWGISLAETVDCSAPRPFLISEVAVMTASTRRDIARHESESRWDGPLLACRITARRSTIPVGAGPVCSPSLDTTAVQPAPRQHTCIGGWWRWSVPLNFDIPDRCLLAQASVYVTSGRVPIPDNIYLAAPGATPEGSIELVRALLTKQIFARGSLGAVYRLPLPYTSTYSYTGDMLPSFGDWMTCLPGPSIRDCQIRPELWSSAQIDFADSKLVGANEQIGELYRMPPVDVDTVRTFHAEKMTRTLEENEARTFREELSLTTIETAFIFSSITVATGDLFAVFPRPSTPTITASRKLAPQPSFKSESGTGAKSRGVLEAMNQVFPDGIPDGVTAKDRDNRVMKWLKENNRSVPAGLSRMIQRVLQEQPPK